MTGDDSSLQTNIRRAAPEDAALLSDLAFRSKGYWGYDADFLEACRPELTFSPDYIEHQPVFVLEAQNIIVGFYSLREIDSAVDREIDSAVELHDLFIDPVAIGNGHGRALWQHAVKTASELGFSTLVIDSDPYAEPFYRAMGAVRVGDVPSTVIPGRGLPLMHFALDEVVSSQ